MLRRILITLGVIVAILPYLGFPHSFDDLINTLLGFFIVFLLVFTKKTHKQKEVAETFTEEPKEISVVRSREISRPAIAIERQMPISKIVKEVMTERAPVKIIEEERVSLAPRRRKPKLSLSEKLSAADTNSLTHVP